MKKMISLILAICMLMAICSFEIGAVSDESPITLKYYDDRMDCSGMDVAIVDAGTPTSFKVGYNVAEGTADTAL